MIGTGPAQPTSQRPGLSPCTTAAGPAAARPRLNCAAPNHLRAINVDHVEPVEQVRLEAAISDTRGERSV